MRPSVFVAMIVIAAQLSSFPLVGNHRSDLAGATAVALASAASTDIPMFSTEQAAQKHCPSDTVVWLNTNSGIYHLKGERWYGRTKHGAYVCKKEADAAGYRETENGQ